MQVMVFLNLQTFEAIVTESAYTPNSVSMGVQANEEVNRGDQGSSSTIES